jgi:LuxR family maltose regulon positive regulatory protein
MRDSQAICSRSGCAVTYPILTTKLFIPSPRADRLPRQRLVEKFNESAAYPLTLISASAGSGKTTLLSEWAAKTDDPVAWVSLESADNDPSQFLIYFISALQTIDTNFGNQALETLQNSQAHPLEAILINLLNQIAELFDEFILIFDDYHLITDLKTNQLVTFLIDHLPHQMHLIIASRMDPPWPLASYRARNQLYELRGQDLRFSLAETAEFLNDTMGLQLSFDEVEALEKRTEGWVAGLQLAAIFMQGSNDVTSLVEAFTGSHLYVAEYLIEEILNQQPEEIQSFLLKTSILKRLNAGLCEAVSCCKDGQSLLVKLHRANIFVIPLDHEGKWFRYHHLFADLLQARLPQSLPKAEIADLHQRASAWYEQNGFIPEAIDHTLIVENYERAAELVKNYALALIYSGRVQTLRDWLEAFPESALQAHPELAFYLFWVDILQNRADLSDQAIQDKENLLKELPSTPENDRLRGELMAVICRAVTFSGRTSKGIRLAQEALAFLPPDSLAARARTLSALATAHDLEGKQAEAEPAYQQSLTLAITAGDLRLTSHTIFTKGLVQIHYGQLRDAAKSFQTIIDMAPENSVKSDSTQNARSNTTFFPAGQGNIGLGIIHLEWNDLDLAENYLEQGMDLCRRGGLDGVFIGKLQMSRLRQAKGDLAGALSEIQPLLQVQRVDDINLVTRQIQIALAGENVDEAWRLAAPLAALVGSTPGSVRMPLLFLEILQAVLARVYLALGEFQKTSQLLTRLQASAEPGGREGHLVETYLLKALVDQKRNRDNLTPQAIEDFSRALELGEPANYVLLFLEEGPAVLPLLEAVIKRSTIPTGIKQYARKLLFAFDANGEDTRPKFITEAVELIEPLTPREQEVLLLLAAGDSNLAIAKKLVITVRTVKKHTSNIYSKLNASSRTQAVALAREFGLLPLDT